MIISNMKCDQKLLIIIALFVLPVDFTNANNCNLRAITRGYNICVCNATYCDTVPPINTNLLYNQYQLYSTSRNNLGFTQSFGSFEEIASFSPSTIIQVDPLIRHQTIIGFGGSFTDSTGINVASLPNTAQDLLLESYFSEKSGIGYSLCRVPIAGTDFSTRPYTYADTDNSHNLSTFQLEPEDFNYKIPFINKAKELRNNESLKLLGSSWTAPLWMKTNNKWSGGHLKDEYYQLWAEYFVKFLDAYAANGIDFWGLTTQNEPLTACYVNDTINSLCWNCTDLNRWINNNFGSTLRGSVYKNIKIVLHDDNRFALPFMSSVINNENTIEYADGVGVHWYADFLLPKWFINYAKTPKKDLFIIYTEASNGYFAIFHLASPLDLGSWQRGQYYLINIIDTLKQGIAGWIDWNMVLDLNGGPNYTGNLVDSPILVNKTAGEFYKQPSFYVLGHFSKFVVADSVRIEASVVSGDERMKWVDVVAFERPDNLTAVILINSSVKDVPVEVRIGKSRRAKITLVANSLSTLLCTTDKLVRLELLDE